MNTAVRILLTALLAAGVLPARAQDASLIPVAIGDAILDPTRAQAVAAALGIPVNTGRPLAGSLHVVADPAAGLDALRAAVQQAEDAFFTGEYETAYARFAQLAAAVPGNPVVCAAPKGVQLAFHIYLYAAWSAREARKRAEMARWLAAAKGRFPEQTPSAVTFPPWLRRLFDQQPAPRPEAALPLDAAQLPRATDCTAFVDGRAVAADAETRVVAGNHCIQIRCGDEAGPVAIVTAPAPQLPALWFPEGYGAAATPEGAMLRAPSGTTPREAAAAIGSFLQRLGVEDAVLLIADHEATSVWNLPSTRNPGLGRPLHRTRIDWSTLETAVPSAPLSADTPRPWYRRGAAWGFAGAGIAAVVTGLVLGLSQGEESPVEPWGWALQFGGIGLSLTGGVLFFVPPPAADPAR